MAERIAATSPALDKAPTAAPDSTARRLVALSEVVLCSSVPTQIALGYALRIAGWTPSNGSGTLSFAYVITLSLGDMALLVALMVLLTRAHGERVSRLWIGARPLRREALVGLALIPGVFVVVILLLNVIRIFLPALHNVENNPLEELARTPVQAFFFGLVAIFAGGVREELQRAFLLQRFEQHLGGPIVGLVLVSVGFGLGPAVQGWDAVVTTGVLGALWAWIYLRRRSSIAPIVSHAGFNAVEIIRAAAFP